MNEEELRQEVARLRAEVDRLDDRANGVLVALTDALLPLLKANASSSWKRTRGRPRTFTRRQNCLRRGRCCIASSKGLGFGAGINPGREALAVAAHAFGDQFVDQRLVGGADQRHQVARRAADGIALALHLHGEIGGDPALLAFPAGGEIGNEYGEHFFCLENHLPVVESRAR